METPGLPPTPPEDQPLTAQHPAMAVRPTWTAFLTPLAIVFGACIVAGTVWLTRGDDDGAGPASGPVVADDNGVAATPTREPSQATPPATILDAFLGYARAAELDESAFRDCLFDSSQGALITTQLRRGTELGITGTPTFFINNKKIVGAQPAAIFQEVIDRELKGSPTSLDAYSANVRALATTSPPRFEIVPSLPDVSDATFDGDRAARVVIAEFSDFQCPFCRRWNEETLGALRPAFGKDVALAFLHFPIVQIHPNAGNASLAAICADKQGKFWDMHDLLFAHQAEWQSLGTN